VLGSVLGVVTTVYIDLKCEALASFTPDLQVSFGDTNII
jgi:hypothetical protein